MAIYTKIIYKKRQDYDCSVLPPKKCASPWEQPQWITNLTAEASIYAQGRKRSMAYLNRLEASDLPQLLPFPCPNWDREGLHHCLNFKWQQAVQVWFPLHEAGESLMGFFINRSFELHLSRAFPYSQLPKDDQTKKEKTKTNHQNPPSLIRL